MRNTSTDPVQQIVNILNDKRNQGPDLAAMLSEVRTVYDSLPSSQQQFVFNYFKLKVESNADYSSKVISYLAFILSIISLFFGPFLDQFAEGRNTSATMAAYTITFIVIIVLMVTAVRRFNKGNRLSEIWQRGYCMLMVIERERLNGEMDS